MDDSEDDRPRIAIVGKPNVGKSSIINKLLGENRVTVSNIAGTTRDAVDTEIVRNGTGIYLYRYGRSQKKEQDQRGYRALQHHPHGNSR